MESKPTSCVIRRLAPSSCRYYPYETRSRSGKKNMKAAVVQLGVKLSVSLAESMFLLSDDIRTMLWFCYKLCKDTHHYQKSESRDASRYQNSESRDANGYQKSDSPVVDRLFRVSHHVYSKYIKPKNGEVQGGGNPVQCELIRTTWKDFADGTVVLHRLVMLLRRKNCSFDDRLLLSAIVKYKQLLKNLEDKLRSAKHVSGENGFASKAMESNIFSFWKSLFDEEAPKAMILKDMFKPLFDQPKGSTFGFISPSELPALKVYSPCILGRGFVKQELEEEVVRLGVELSLYVAELMFLLCDDIGTMLRFCYMLWRDVKWNKKPNNPVVERLLRVIHYVYLKYIKPKNGVYQNGGRSVQWRLFKMARENFEGGIRDLELLVFVLRGGGGGGSFLYVGTLTTSIEETLKKVEGKLRCTKTVSEANGFAREAMESNILDLWKSVFDKEAKEATQTMQVINNGMLSDLFLPLVNAAAAPPPP